MPSRPEYACEDACVCAGTGWWAWICVMLAFVAMGAANARPRLRPGKRSWHSAGRGKGTVRRHEWHAPRWSARAAAAHGRTEAAGDYIISAGETPSPAGEKRRRRGRIFDSRGIRPEAISRASPPFLEPTVKFRARFEHFSRTGSKRTTRALWKKSEHFSKIGDYGTLGQEEGTKARSSRARSGIREREQCAPSTF